LLATAEDRRLQGFFGRRLAMAAPPRGRRGALLAFLCAFAAATAFAATGNPLELRTTETGVYRVDASTIATAIGVSTGEVAVLVGERRLRLSSGGERIAWQPYADNAGIEFFSLPFETRYTGTRVFLLEQGRALVPPALAGAPPVATAPAGRAFPRTTRVEVNYRDQTSIVYDADDDWWFWFYLYGGKAKSCSFELDGTVTSAIPAKATVRLVGASETPHTVGIEINGVQIGTAAWQNRTEHEVTFSVPANLLSDNNTLRVANQGGSTSVIFMDWMDVTYGRGYGAQTDELLLDAAGYALVTVTNLASSQVHAWDVTDWTLPVPLTATRVDHEGGERYSVTFEPPDTNSTCFAWSSAATRTPQVLTGGTVHGLRSSTNGADYLVITDPMFRNALQPLVAHRRGEGLTTRVVDIEEVYDAFAWAEAGPSAVRRFLGHVYDVWRPRPTYVVLGGHGGADPRNYEGDGENAVPIVMVSTAYGLLVSDVRLADVKGSDGIPEFAVGRLPAITPHEMTNLVAKILDYETNAGGAWTQQVVLAADNADSAGDFPRDSNVLAGMMPTAYTNNKVYLSELSVTEARDLLKGRINSGCAWVNYMGHGSWKMLANEGLLTKSDVGTLTNAPRYAFFSLITCAANRFDNPGAEYLGEALLNDPDGSAIAVWGPTGLGPHHSGFKLAQRFLTARYIDGERRLGIAIRNALADYIGSGGQQRVSDTYALLGDPATVMK